MHFMLGCFCYYFPKKKKKKKQKKKKKKEENERKMCFALFLLGFEIKVGHIIFT